MSRTIGELLDQHARALSPISDSPKLDCQMLMAKVTGHQRAWLLAHDDEALSCSDQARLAELVERRLAGEPMAYITGSKGFWQREFELNQATLIPRPETELLIEILLQRFDQTALSVLDLGTGTGAIAITLAAERPQWQILAVDIDEQAVSMARSNASDLNNVTVQQGNWFEGIDREFQLIVSNPPYIAEDDPHLDTLTFEPRAALVSGTDGLDAIRTIVAEADLHLAADGCLLLEHGYDQQSQVVGLFAETGLTDIETFRDLQGQPRAVMGRKRTEISHRDE